MNVVSEPAYVPLLASTFSDHIFYRPFLPLLNQQESLEAMDQVQSNVANKKKINDRLEKLKSFYLLGNLWLDLVYKSDHITYSSLVSAYDDNSHISLNLVQKNALFLLCSDLVVADCNSTDFGERSFDIFLANLLEIPVMGTSERFLNSPWLHLATTAMVKSSELTTVLKLHL